MGASGSGKSTLMNLLGCLDRPTDGRYLLDGTDVSELGPQRARRHPQPEARIRLPGLQPARPDDGAGERGAADDVRPSGASTAARCASARCTAWSIVGLANRADHFPASSPAASSSAWRSPARWPTSPQVLLADEPTGNLDSKTSVEVMGVFQKLNDQGITIIMVTHELDIARYCKRNLILRDGQLSTTSGSPTA